MLKRVPDLLKDWNIFATRNSGNVKIFCNKVQQENIHTDIRLKEIL